MSTIIRLDDSLVRQIDALAKERHTNQSNIVRKAVIHFLEDNEDLKLATIAEKKSTSFKSLKQIRKGLGFGPLGKY